MPKKIEKKVNKISEKSDPKEKKKLSELEFEEKVIELADKGLTSEKIGEALRQEGIHPKEHTKRISQILKEKEKYINPDLKNIEKKLEKIDKHLEKHKKDRRAEREKHRIFAQQRKFKKYFKVAIK